jgi:hypothetical protein
MVNTEQAVQWGELKRMQGPFHFGRFWTDFLEQNSRTEKRFSRLMAPLTLSCHVYL